MATCPYCKEDLYVLNRTSSYLQKIDLNTQKETDFQELLEQHYQCPECGEILSEDDLSEMVKPVTKPKTETAKQGSMELG